MPRPSLTGLARERSRNVQWGRRWSAPLQRALGAARTDWHLSLRRLGDQQAIEDVVWAGSGQGGLSGTSLISL